jgi:hypothetical protein
MTAARIVTSLVVTAIGIAFGNMSKPGDARFRPTRASESFDVATSSSSSAPDRVTATLASLLHQSDLRQLAQAGILARGLNEREMAELLDRLERLISDDADNLLLRLVADWTRRDAKAASAWIRPRLDRIARSVFFGVSADFDSNLVNAWIGHAPEIALEYVRENPGTSLADMMLSNAVQRLRGKSGAEKLAVLLTFPEGQSRDHAMNSLFFSWIQSDRGAAFAGALSLPPGAQRDITVGQVLASWAQSNPTEAFAHFEKSGITDPTFPLVLVSNGAKQDPAATIRWLEKQSPETIAKCGAIFVSGWAKKDPVAALNWALARGVSLTEWPLPSSSERAELSKWKQPYVDLNLDPPFASAIREKTDETLAWLKSVPAGPERNRLIETAFFTAANLPQVRDLVAELPTESAVKAARICVLVLVDDSSARETFAASLPAGPVREAAWLAVGIRSSEPVSLPPGPDRNAMLQGMVTTNYTKPERAWQLLQQIDDPRRQWQAWDDVAFILSSMPASATSLQTWLNLPDMPEEWKRPWKSK